MTLAFLMLVVEAPKVVSSTSWLTIITVLLGGGFITALIQVYRAKPDRDSVVVSSAQNASEIFKGLNEALYAELERERQKSARLSHWSDVLEDQIRDSNIDIPWDKRRDIFEGRNPEYNNEPGGN